MKGGAADVAARLAENAEAVCKEYLSQGRRSGNYWLAGDVHDNPGRSLFVRLVGSARGGAAPRANGRMPRPGSMAIFSTSSRLVSAIPICATRSPKPAPFSTSRHASRRVLPNPFPATAAPLPGGCSPPRGPFGAPLAKPTCAHAGSRARSGFRRCAFTPTPTTARTMAPHCKPGRR